MVFNATFNNISVISWRRKQEYPEKTTDLPQVTDKLYHIMQSSRVLLVLRVTPGYSSNKTDRHDITGIMLKVVLSTISVSLEYNNHFIIFFSATPPSGNGGSSSSSNFLKALWWLIWFYYASELYFDTTTTIFVYPDSTVEFIDL